MVYDAHFARKSSQLMIINRRILRVFSVLKKIKINVVLGKIAAGGVCEKIVPSCDGDDVFNEAIHLLR